MKWNETRRIGAILACFYVARVWQRGFLVWLRVLAKAEYSAFESTLNSAIVSYRIVIVIVDTVSQKWNNNAKRLAEMM